MKNLKKLLILTLCFTLVFSTTVTTSYEIDPLTHHENGHTKK